MPQKDFAKCLRAYLNFKLQVSLIYDTLFTTYSKYLYKICQVIQEGAKPVYTHNNLNNRI